MDKVLSFLDGKKAIILAVASAVLSYLSASGVLTPDLAALFQTILSILGGGAVALTSRAKKLGRI